MARERDEKAMRREQRLGRALEELAQRATGAQINVRRLTTRQALGADEAVLEATSQGLAGGTALATSDLEGKTLRYFMVGKDGFTEGESWVLG